MRRPVLLGVLGLVACGGSPAPTASTADEVALRPPLELEVLDLTSEDEAGSSLAEAESVLVEADVTARRSSSHGDLPPIQRSGDGDLGPDAWPKVEVVNQTPHRLVVWFAGPCPRTVGLAPEQRFEVEVCAGGYDIAAQLDHPEFLPFVGAGDRVDDGHRYRLTFYVVSEPGRRDDQRLRRRRRP